MLSVLQIELIVDFWSHETLLSHAWVLITEVNSMFIPLLCYKVPLIDPYKFLLYFICRYNLKLSMCLVAFIHKRMTGIGILSVCRCCGLSFLRVQLRLGDFVNFYSLRWTIMPTHMIPVSRISESGLSRVQYVTLIYSVLN